MFLIPYHSYLIKTVCLLFIITMLTNTLGWSFNSKVYTHELEHLRYSELFTANPENHRELHRELSDNGEIDAATHLCLHAAGQYQPFYFNSIITAIMVFNSIEAILVNNPKLLPEIILEAFLRPPISSNTSFF